MIGGALWFLFIAGTLFVVLGLWFLVYYILNPHLEDPHGKARLTGICGDTMEIGLQLRDNRVVKASFWTDGCLYSLNCVCAAAELAKGKDPDEILDIDAEVIRERIGGLPKDHMHCARLAAETLLAAVDNYMLKANQNSKRMRLRLRTQGAQRGRQHQTT